MHIHFPVLNFSKLFIPKLDKNEFIYWFKQLEENDFRSVPHASLNKLFLTKGQRLPWNNIELVMLKNRYDVVAVDTAMVQAYGLLFML